MLLESQVSSLLSLFFPRPLLTPLTFQRQGVFQPSILTVERNWSSSSPTSPPQQRHSPGGLGCGPCGRLFGIRRGFLPTLLALERAQQGSLCDRAVLISQLASLEAFVDGGWRRCIWGSSFTPPPRPFFFFFDHEYVLWGYFQRSVKAQLTSLLSTKLLLAMLDHTDPTYPNLQRGIIPVSFAQTWAYAVLNCPMNMCKPFL